MKKDYTFTKVQDDYELEFEYSGFNFKAELIKWSKEYVEVKKFSKWIEYDDYHAGFVELDKDKFLQKLMWDRLYKIIEDIIQNGFKSKENYTLKYIGSWYEIEFDFCGQRFIKGCCLGSLRRYYENYMLVDLGDNIFKLMVIPDGTTLQRFTRYKLDEHVSLIYEKEGFK